MVSRSFLAAALFIAAPCLAEISIAHQLPVGAPAFDSKIQKNFSKEKWELGKSLFFDPILSRTHTQSCATCHSPNNAFTSQLPTAVGANGFVGDRNIPVLFNRAWSTFQFWDGRVATLEDQIFHPILNKNEMGNELARVIATLSEDSEYKNKFVATFSELPTKTNVQDAIATFIRSIVSGDSPYDKFVAGDLTALSEIEKQGKDLFFHKFRCNSCHSGYNFTNEVVKAACLSNADPTINASYIPRYKVPTLRNLSFSAPYLHDGSLAKLSEVLDYYDGSGPAPKNTADHVDFPRIQMTPKEKTAMMAFLKSLDGKIYYYVPEK